MARFIIAIVSGVVIAVALVFAVIIIGHKIFPTVPMTASTDPEQIKAAIDSLPIGALIFPPLSWFVGAFGGGIVAALIAREHDFIVASIVSAFILIAAITTLLEIPHPFWVALLGIALIVSAPWLAVRATAAARRGSVSATDE